MALLETFDDQAAIAIENAWLFEELQERNASLRESLAQQTATVAVLGVGVGCHATHVQRTEHHPCKHVAIPARSLRRRKR